VSVLICLILLWISRLCCLTSRRSQPPLRLQFRIRGRRFQVGGGSAFYVRPLPRFVDFAKAGLAGGDFAGADFDE
jgi:hypothetical protein